MIIFLRKWRFSDVMCRHFGKKGKCLKTVDMFSFEVRCIRNTPNGIKLNSLQNGYLGFSIFFYFNPQKSKFQFIMGIHVIKIHTNNMHTKFQSNIFVFGCAMAKKRKSDDITFLKCNFWNFQLLYKKTNDILGILRQNCTR